MAGNSTILTERYRGFPYSSAVNKAPAVPATLEAWLLPFVLFPNKYALPAGHFILYSLCYWQIIAINCRHMRHFLSKLRIILRIIFYVRASRPKKCLGKCFGAKIQNLNPHIISLFQLTSLISADSLCARCKLRRFFRFPFAYYSLATSRLGISKFEYLHLT